jgi:hypothetical protein
MANFKIVWDIELEAENPLEAAKKAQEWLKENDTNWSFYVQNDRSDEIFSVDLADDDENAVLLVTKGEYKPMIQE